MPYRTPIAEFRHIRDHVGGRDAGTVPYLRAVARILGGHYHLRAAISDGDSSGPRTALARVYIRRLLPDCAGLLRQVRAGAAGLNAPSDEDFTA